MRNLRARTIFSLTSSYLPFFTKIYPFEFIIKAAGKLKTVQFFIKSLHFIIILFPFHHHRGRSEMRTIWNSVHVLLEVKRTSYPDVRVQKLWKRKRRQEHKREPLIFRTFMFPSEAPPLQRHDICEGVFTSFSAFFCGLCFICIVLGAGGRLSPPTPFPSFAVITASKRNPGTKERRLISLANDKPFLLMDDERNGIASFGLFLPLSLWGIKMPDLNQARVL